MLPAIRSVAGIIFGLLLLSQTAVASSIVSDDFSSQNLNQALWTPIDPVGDSSFSVGNGELRLSVGGGVQHDVWTSGNQSMRIMQLAPDVDFELETKFASVPSQQYQMQGILIEQDNGTFLRFDLYSDGSFVHVFSATFANGSAAVRYDSVVSVGASSYLRISRSGDQWTLALSTDGASWSTVTSYNFAMIVTSVGAFVGNAGASAPAYTGIVDYIFNTASPIIPEDGGVGGPDTTPPGIFSDSATAVSDTEVRVSWTTDEPADGLVEYGLTTAYELGSVASTDFTTSHDILIGSLVPNQNYQFRFTTTDPSGNSSVSGNYAAETSALPVIDIWYGDNQTFGLIGDPQWLANILGNVSDPDGIATLTYSLNGATAQPLNLGPDGIRLALAGDFNIELQIFDLAVGSNSIDIVATDNTGLQSTKSVLVNYAGPNIWPADYSIDWSTTSQIADVAQVVDGKWVLDSGTVRPVELGYDRLIAFGDDSWQNFEVLVELTVNGLDPLCSQQWCPGGGPLVGVLARWPGHYYWGIQPNHGWYPMGSLAAYSWRGTYTRFEMYRGSDGSIGPTDVSAALPLGVPHMFKMRAETVAGVQRYSAKLWPSSQSEPSNWNTVLDEPLSATASGSALLVAHHADVSFGNVTVTSLGGSPPVDTTPPLVSNIQVSGISASQATVTWQTDEPATSIVSYGPSTSYENGSTSTAALVTSHSVLLSNLSSNSLYHFQVGSADSSGNASSSSDLTFTTSSGTAPPTDMVSDDFTGALNMSVWSFNDPQGDSTVTTTGTQLAISVPAGTPHDIWSGSNLAPRVTQAVTDTDFEVEVKFDSAVTARYQLQGVVVEQDANILLRFDFYSDGSQTHAFSATFSNGVPTVRRDITIAGGAPLYLRVNRTGDIWTYSYSYDGIAWIEVVTFTHALSVANVGVFAGNAGPAPAHTALIDYFLVTGGASVPPDTTPPVISNVQATAIGENQATITWQTDEPAGSTVVYGTTSQYTGGIGTVPGLTTSHSVTLTGLTPSTVYHYEASSADSSGNGTASGDLLFVTADPPPADITPPSISNIQIAALTDSQATITWQTDEPADSAIAYGPSGAYEDGVVVDISLVTTHSLDLTGLLASTQYHYEVRSTDSSGNNSNSGDLVFTTAAPVIPPSGIQSDGFNGPFDTTLWSFSDPLGDSAATTTGSQLAISVPAGTSHDLWAGSYDAPRVLQSIVDTDLEVVAKFDSAVTLKYQLQGIVVEQDSSNLVRFDFYSDGTNTHVFAASFTNGSPSVHRDITIAGGAPLYLRVQRQSNIWTQSYSYDGVNWITAVSFNYALTASTAGLFAGNFGSGNSAPAHTALVDSFQVVQ